MTPRKAKSRIRPEPGKGRLNPTAVVGTPDYDDPRTPLFSFEYADREYNGAWSWPDGADAGHLLRFLVEVSQSSWARIHLAVWDHGGRRHHEQEIGDLCPQAQARISELGHDQRFDYMYRFGVTKRKRLWGFAELGVYYVLWWDPEHQVCPLPRM